MVAVVRADLGIISVVMAMAVDNMLVRVEKKWSIRGKYSLLNISLGWKRFKLTNISF